MVDRLLASSSSSEQRRTSSVITSCNTTFTPDSTSSLTDLQYVTKLQNQQQSHNLQRFHHSAPSSPSKVHIFRKMKGSSSMDGIFVAKTTSSSHNDRRIRHYPTSTNDSNTIRSAQHHHERMNSLSELHPPLVVVSSSPSKAPLSNNNNSCTSSSADRASSSSFLLELWKSLDAIIFSSRLTWLLVLGPIAVVGESTGALKEHWLFLLAGLALIPCAERLSFITEQVAEHTNSTIGALLNATFGNAPELLISVAALRSGYYRVVQLAMLGSMLTNLMLVFGVACIIGGCRYQVQYIRQSSGNVSVILLMVATAGSLFPAALVLAGHFPNPEAPSYDGAPREEPSDMHRKGPGSSFGIRTNNLPSEEEVTLCRVNAFVMLILYFCYLVFQLGTHKEEFDEQDEIQSHRKHAQPNVACIQFGQYLTSIVTKPSQCIHRYCSRKCKNHPVEYEEVRIHDFSERDGVEEEKASLTLGRKAKDSGHGPCLMNAGGRTPNGSSHRRHRNLKNSPDITTMSDANEMHDEENHNGIDNSDQVSANNENTLESIIPVSPHRNPISPESIATPQSRQRKRNDSTNTSGKEDVAAAIPLRSPFMLSQAHKSKNSDAQFPLDDELDPSFSSNDVNDQLVDPEIELLRLYAASDNLENEGYHRSLSGISKKSVLIVDELHSPESEPLISLRVGIFWLFVMTLCISSLSDVLVDTIDGFAGRMHLSEVFTSMVIIPFFSNIAEQVSAFIFAYRNEMDLCVGVTVGSAVQIATMVLPGSVLIGMALDRNMTLYFHSFETVSLFFGVIVVAAILQGGSTNWLVGAMLVGIYVMFAAGIWYHQLEDLNVDIDSTRL